MNKKNHDDRGVIIVLGSPNSDRGKLYSIAKERCELAIKEYNKRKNYSLLLTGGYGAHFNKSNDIHAAYLKNYMINKRIPERAFIEFAKSANTLEDASLSKPIVLKYEFNNIIVITSDYHIDRARIIFENEYSGSNIKITYLASITNEDNCEINLTPIKKHEIETLKKLKNNASIL